MLAHFSTRDTKSNIAGVADAGVVKYNGKYYIGGVHTNGDFYISDDLVHWGKPVHVVSIDNDWIRDSKVGNDQIHANHMLYDNGTFHLYWSVNYWGKDKHAVHIVHAQSDSILGPYIERLRQLGWTIVLILIYLKMMMASFICIWSVLQMVILYGVER